MFSYWEIFRKKATYCLISRESERENSELFLFPSSHVIYFQAINAWLLSSFPFPGCLSFKMRLSKIMPQHPKASLCFFFLQTPTSPEQVKKIINRSLAFSGVPGFE